MGGIGDFVFGSGGSSDTDRKSTLTPEQKELLEQLIGELGGPALAGLDEEDFGLEQTELELTSLEGLQNLVNTLPGGARLDQDVQETTQSSLNALERIFESGPQDIDEFFTETVQEPLLEDFSDVMEGIQNRFAPQFFGGERREAEARAREDLFDALTRERARVGFTERARDLDRDVSASAVTPGVGAFGSSQDFIAPGARGNILEGTRGAGTATQGTRQRQLDERSRRISEILGSLGIPGIENIVTAQDPSAGFLSSAFGPAITAFASNPAAFGFSDERLKEDIEKIAEADEGYGIYKYRFKGDSDMKIGVIAQELEKFKPEAVFDAGGIKMVDFEAL